MTATKREGRRTRIQVKPRKKALSARVMVYNLWFYQFDAFIKDFIATPEVIAMEDHAVYHDKVKGGYVDVLSLLEFNHNFFRILNNRKKLGLEPELNTLADLFSHFNFESLDLLEPLDRSVYERLGQMVTAFTRSLNALTLAEASDIVLTLRIKKLTDKMELD